MRRRHTVALALALALLAGVGAVPGHAVARPGVVAELGAARAPVSELVPMGSVVLPGGTVVYRYGQEVAGVAVVGAQAVVADPPAMPATLVADTTAMALAGAPRWAVTRDAAIEAALAGVGARRLDAPVQAHRVIARRGDGVAAWQVTVPSRRPLGDFEVLVEGSSGEVLAIEDLMRFSRVGDAKLYKPNPVVVQGNANNLRDDHDRNSARLTRLREPVKLRHLRSGQSCLFGRWAHVVEGPQDREVCKPSLDWRRIKREDDRFEALMSYFHLDKAQKYIRSLGFSDRSGDGAGDRRTLVHANGISEDNSYFRPSQNDITFGSGAVDDGEDADVIWHEYGHAIQDDQVERFGRGNEGGAMGEGFGDYLSAALTAETGGTNNVDALCIFDWDGLAWGSFQSSLGRKCGRRANDQRTLGQAQNPLTGCPGGITNIHCVGQVWSSALWDLREALGRDVRGRRVMDRVVIAHHFLLTDNARFDDAANALLMADLDLYGGTHQNAIRNEMEQRGIL